MPAELPTPVPLPAAKPGLTGRHVFLALLAFFGVIFAVNMTMMTLAIRSMPGTEVKSTYEASQRFNRGLDVIAAQDRRGWQVDIAVKGIRNGGMLGIEVRDRAGQPLDDLTLRARFARPIDASQDRQAGFGNLGGGRYSATLPTLAAGQWALTVEIDRGGERQFVSRQRIVIQE